MEFRTTIKPSENRGLLTHSDGVMMIGSCFSDNIGAKLRTAMMNVDVNPFGTIYNPYSIAESVNRIIDCRLVNGADMFQANGVWNSYSFHSRFSKSDKMLAMQRMNERIEAAHNNLKEAQVLAITLGTAMVYRLKSSNEVVCNCHKVPQHEFDRSMESIDSMAEVLDQMMQRLLMFNPDLKVIFTVSPIRHVADGLQTNQLSKASLRVVVNEIVEKYLGVALYFPAYEIMLDDLRDYRFYAADMVHPSEVAVEYIWQVFQASFFDDRTAQAVARCERVWKRLTHRPMSDNREALERFNADTKTVVRNLLKEYPHIAKIKEIKNVLD